jgi:hypothetical protein
MMSYHAFLFDYDAFARELKPLVEECLRSGATGPLEDFIERNRFIKSNQIYVLARGQPFY